MSPLILLALLAACSSQASDTSQAPDGTGVCCPIGRLPCQPGIALGGWAASAEECASHVSDWYDGSFDRGPDANGCDTWTNRGTSGGEHTCGLAPLPDAGAGVCCPIGRLPCQPGIALGGWAASAEECASHVSDCYDGSFDRGPDANGCDTWTNRGTSGGEYCCGCVRDAGPPPER